MSTVVDSSLPFGATGIVFQNNGKACTGTLIKRDVVLTAGHCFCEPGVKPTHFGIPGRVALQVKGFHTHIERCPPKQEDDASKDLGIVFLVENVGTDAVPRLPKVYLWGDLPYKGNTVPPYWMSLPWSAGTGAGPELFDNGIRIDGAHLDASVYYDDANWYDFLGIGTGSTWMSVWNSDHATFERGDSGGPLLYQRSDGTWFIVGVNSAKYSVSQKLTRQLFSPTWANGDGNGTWIAQFMDDADDDEVNDSLDNCPPMQCLTAGMCWNPGQEDRDGDGIGDACDNCPDHPNKDQSDMDGDRIGDVCDPCPHLPNPYPDLDDYPDGDGVPTVCDNCRDAHNPYQACVTDADCHSPCPIADKPTRCIRADKAGVGRCSRQIDDLDCDGRGPGCDTCEGVEDTGAVLFSTVPLNSNAAAESRETPAAPILDDRCDPVPLLVAKPVAVEQEPGDPNDDTPDPSDTVELAVTRGIGRDLSVPGGGTQDHAPYVGTAGFRQCNCYVGGVPKPLEECLGSPECPNNREAYDDPTYWQSITVSTKGNEFKPTFADDLLRGAEISNRLFTSVVKTTGKDYDPGRVGEREHVAWRWWKDIDVQDGPIASYEEYGVRKTAGILWSHTKSEGIVASDRDETYDRRLRDSYHYVKTPFYRPGWELFTPVAPDLVNPCDFNGCGPWLRVELWRPRPPPEIVDDSILGRLDGPVRLVFRDDRLVLLRDGGRPPVDATDRLPSALLSMLASGDRTWLTPVEREDRTFLRKDATHMVALPTAWQATSMVTPVVATEAGLSVRPTDVVDGPFLFQAMAEDEPQPRAMPDARTGARSLLTLTEQAVYMVGGERDGHPTGEIWRYHLDGAVWRPAFGSSAPRPGRVLGAGYDYTNQKLLVLDELPPSIGLGPKRARFVVYDTAERTGEVLLAVPRVGFYERLALVGREDGSFLLFGTRSGKTDVFRMILTDRRVRWTGYAQLVGRLIDDPIYTTRGVVVPLQRGTAYEQQTFVDSALKGQRPCGSL